MTTSSATLPVAPYRDRKRYAWLLSLAMPVLLGSGPALALLSSNPWLPFLPVALYFAILPFLDLVLGTDPSNPPEDVVPALEADRYYRYVTFASVPLLWIVFTFGIWVVATQALPWHAMLASMLSLAMVGGYCINIGHELGHKREAAERWLAKIVLAPTCYGHFFVEHNRGHHRDVATPEDPASSRMGENLYRFALRELPGAVVRAFELERTRLVRAKKSTWTLENEFLQPLLITVVYWTVLAAWLGIAVLPILLAVSLFANFQLTLANYIEHYGLLRQRRNGVVEVCHPRHSWNSNRTFSNWITFHLQRHSDHHAHPLRRYQSLRHFDDVPQLPTGYFGMFLLAYVPPLWFRVMDKRVVEAVGRDVERINFDPSRRDALIRAHGLAPVPAIQS